MRSIRKSFYVATPESVAHGDFAKSGWIDEQGTAITPDEYDIDEYGSELLAVIGLVKKYFSGNVYPSSSGFHPLLWYSSVDADIDYQTGADTTYSYFLDGFAVEELRAIYNELTKRS